MDEHTAETFDQKYEREAAEADAFLARCAERRLAQQPEPKKPQLKARPQMDMNEWFAAGFRNFAALERQWVHHQFDLVTKLIAEEVDKREIALRLEIRARVKTMQADIAALRAEVESLRKIAKPDVNLTGVVPLRGRDVA